MAGGDLTFAMPQVRGAGQSFHSRLLPPYLTRMREPEDVISLLYLHGPSTRRVRKALGKWLGKRGLSKTTVVCLTQRLVETFVTWRQRDLSPLEVVYLFLDGIRLGVRKGTREKEAVLVAHAVLADGRSACALHADRREVLAVALGSRESTRAWMDLLEDLKRRGLSEPLLIITHGRGGLLAAVEAHFPHVARQHCTKHKLANVLEKVPKGSHLPVRGRTQTGAEVGDAARPRATRGLYTHTLAQTEEALVLFERAPSVSPRRSSVPSETWRPVGPTTGFPFPTGSGFGPPMSWSEAFGKCDAGCVRSAAFRMSCGLWPWFMPCSRRPRRAGRPSR